MSNAELKFTKVYKIDEKCSASKKFPSELSAGVVGMRRVVLHFYRVVGEER